jgi:sugar phosphate isomerase/epimerase
MHPRDLCRCGNDAATDGDFEKLRNRQFKEIDAMKQIFYAMDTSFYTSLGSYDFDVRCEMLKELGYDATYLTAWSEVAWNDVPKLKDVRKKHGLEVTSVYTVYDLSKGKDEENNGRIGRLIQTIEGCQNIQIAVTESKGQFQKSDPSGDDTAQAALQPLLEQAKKRGIQLLLYPHINTWLERIEDAVRVCRKLEHPNLGVVFCSYHWFAVDGENLSAHLAEASPFLRDVNLCGSRRIKDPSGTRYTLEPLDDGELDNFAVLGALESIKYRGMIGVQGYSVAGDVYVKLRRSIAAYKDMRQRLEKHPEWAKMRP